MPETVCICPSCGSDLRDTPIPESSREMFGSGSHFLRLIGVVENDRCRRWRCPDCNYEAQSSREFEGPVVRSMMPEPSLEQMLADCARAVGWTQDDMGTVILPDPEIGLIELYPMSSHDDIMALQAAMVEKMGEEFAWQFVKIAGRMFLTCDWPHPTLGEMRKLLELSPPDRLRALWAALPEEMRTK